MTYEIVLPVIIAFAISAVLGPIVIPFLRRLKVGQTERKELESHLKNERNAYYGRTHDIGEYRDHIPVLCEGLSEDHPGFIYDRGIRCHWIFR